MSIQAYRGINPLMPRFGGVQATRAVQTGRWADLKELFRQDGDMYLGEPPAVLTQTTGLSARGLGEVLNTLCSDMRDLIREERKNHWGRPRETWQGEHRDNQHWCRNIKRMREIAQAHSPKLKRQCGLTLDYIAGGTFGAVFKLTAGKQSYALKVFPDLINHHEALKAIHFTHKNVRDLAHCYWADSQEGWLLMEYIDSGTQLEDREGPSFAELGVSVTDIGRHDDEIGDHNDINGIIVDYGSIGWYQKP